jgi:hypothetical protein
MVFAAWSCFCDDLVLRLMAPTAPPYVGLLALLTIGFVPFVRETAQTVLSRARAGHGRRIHAERPRTEVGTLQRRSLVFSPQAAWLARILGSVRSIAP